MIKSCLECKTKCCSTGPGPYKKINPDDYLDNFGQPDAYNTQCDALNDKGMCSLWGTPEFPLECRVYVCQSREYSKKELKKIESFEDEMDCPKCESYLVFSTFNKKKRLWAWHCEVCDWKEEWIKQ